MTDFGGLSADQINASMYGGFSPAQGQSVLNNIFGNFGQQTDYYSGLGAAYGRQTGGFNALPLNQQSPLQQEQQMQPGATFDQRYGGPQTPTPFDMYNNGGYDPFAAQSYQPAATLPSQPQSALPSSGWGDTSQPHWDMSQGWVGGDGGLSFSDRMSGVPNYSVAPNVQNWGASFNSPLGGSAAWPTNPWQSAPQPQAQAQPQPQPQGNSGGGHWDMDQGWVGGGSAAPSDSFAERFAGVGATPQQAPTPQLPDIISTGTSGVPMPYMPGYSPSTFDGRFNAMASPGPQSSNATRDNIAMAMMQQQLPPSIDYGGGA
jgi:hypothetical protein